jgi:hypothetical protein
MSGGSYSYLHRALWLDLMVKQLDDLEEMAERLEGLGYAADTAWETRQLLLTLRSASALTDVTTQRMFEVWKAVEWWDSGDWGEDSVVDALTAYRERGHVPPVGTDITEAPA